MAGTSADESDLHVASSVDEALSFFLQGRDQSGTTSELERSVRHAYAFCHQCILRDAAGASGGRRGGLWDVSRPCAGAQGNDVSHPGATLGGYEILSVNFSLQDTWCKVDLVRLHGNLRAPLGPDVSVSMKCA
jgi:hypothetical protein